jgi:hypothetical protein
MSYSVLNFDVVVSRVSRRVVSLLVALAAVAACVSVCAATASASRTRFPEPFSPLTGAGTGVGLHAYGPSAIAVDEATGNVFASDGGGEGEGLIILGGEGGAPAGLTSPYVVPGTTYFDGNTGAFVGYDNSATSPDKGTLYAFDPASEVIEGYVRNAATEQYEEVVGKQISAPGCAEYEIFGGGIDENGDLYFVCAGREDLVEAGPSGTILHEYSLSGTPIDAPGQIAVDSAGDVFVQVQVGGLYKLPVKGAGEVEPARYQEVTSEANGVAYEPDANVVIATQSGKVVEFDADTLAKIGEFGGEALVVEYDGESYPAQIERVAINAHAHRVYVVDSSNLDVAVFGPEVIIPTTTATAASNVTGSKATLNGSVDPEGVEVTECFFEYGPSTSYGHTTPCEGTLQTNGETQAVSAEVAGLAPDGATYHYRLVTKNENGQAKSADKTLVTSETVITEAATGVGPTVATLNGVARPEGLPLSGCAFEYKLSTGASYETAPCSPTASEIEPDFTAHAVAASLTTLQPNSAYEFRLRVTNAEAVRYGTIQRFTTTGPAQITEVRARDATQSSVELEARIDPSGFGTSFRFEWGATSGYDHDVPAEFEPYIGSGSQPVRVTAKLSGLAAGTVYHFRVVATSLQGAVSSPDTLLETLDACGLPEGRCLEMVSPREPGPGALAGGVGFSTEEPELHYQAAEGSGSLAYMEEIGLPEASTSTDILYKGVRAEGGWESSQYSSGISELGGRLPYGRVLSLSPTLECGVVDSTQQLTSDPAARLITEAGGSNLYRRNADGSYTLITSLVPEKLESNGDSEYELIGMSRNCERVVFTSEHHYPGVEGAGNMRLYEWGNETLKNVGWAPAAGGEQTVEATASEDKFGDVSEDGSRVFFTATNLVGADVGEVGETGVFVREDGDVTKSVSASETATPDTGAVFQGATPDGSRVYFLANAGLTTESSAEGTDLYEYDLETQRLTDISVDSEAGGAEAGSETGGGRGALVGVADDGSHVYFVATGQLEPGEGAALAENEANETISLYDYEASRKAVTFVATVSANKFELGPLTVEDRGSTTSRVSPDGRYLLFESRRSLTGYEGAGGSEVYLYDASATTESLVCISCRQDGRPSNYVSNAALHLESSGSSYGRLRWDWPQTLVEREGQPLVFFESHDGLAEGAVEGENNLYEWSHGEVYEIASDLPGATSKKGFESGGTLLSFAGASTDGGDLYFFDAGALNWEDPEARRAAWDARVGGGFAEPAATPVCKPTSEGSCQGATSPPPGSTPPLSSTYSGPGDAEPAPAKPKEVGGKSKKGGKKRGAKKQKRKVKKKHGAKRKRGVPGKHAKGRRSVKKDARSRNGKGAALRTIGNEGARR